MTGYNSCISRRKVEKEIAYRKWVIFLRHPDRT